MWYNIDNDLSGFDFVRYYVDVMKAHNYSCKKKYINFSPFFFFTLFSKM